MLLGIINVFRLQGHYNRDYRERRDVRWTSAEGSVPMILSWKVPRRTASAISRRMTKYQAHSVILFAIQ